MMKILVTGASGFIGSNLCRALLAQENQGIQVRAFHRPRLDNKAPRLLENLDVERFTGDIADLDTVSRAVKGIQIIFHTAAKLGSQGSLETLYSATVNGTKNVLRAAQKAGVERLIHTSSVAALGVPGWDLPAKSPAQLIDERHTWNFRPEWWRYGHTKYQAELVVQQAVANGLDVVIVNPAVVMGQGDINRIGGDIIFKIASGRFPISLPGGLNIVHINDVVAGHLAALKKGRTGERYILAGENLTHLEFHQQVTQIVSDGIRRIRRPVRTIPAAPVRALAGPLSLVGDLLPVSTSFLRRIGYYFYYSNRKARQELGMAEPLCAQQAVVDAFHWYRAEGML
jgi:dihydroflavonol-4-reductase